MSGLRLESLRGEAIRARFEPLADLRITVFREWPYLYEGSRAYEASYLDTYFRDPQSLVVLVWDGAQCVGATSAIALTRAPEEARTAFGVAGHDLSTIDYFGESLLLPGYRGRGLGVQFFALREAHARELGLRQCAFCAVQRAPDDPRRPASAADNAPFWHRRGYRPVAGLTTRWAWPDLGERDASLKPMQFWMRELPA